MCSACYHQLSCEQLVSVFSLLTVINLLSINSYEEVICSAQVNEFISEIFIYKHSSEHSLSAFTNMLKTSQ